MTTIAESAASLVISGDDLEPDAVSALVRAQPHRGVRKGGAIILPGGGHRIADTGIWECKARPRQPADPDAQIAEIFAALSDDPQAWAAVAKRCRIEIRVGLFLDNATEAVALRPGTLRLLADRSAGLVLDIIAPYTPANSCGG